MEALFVRSTIVFIPVKTTGFAVGAATAAVLLALTTAAPVTASPVPVAMVDVPAGAQVVPGSYVVQLRGPAPLGRAMDRGDVVSVASDLASDYGGTVKQVYSAALRGFAVRMSAQRAARLAADPRVARVEPDTIVTVAGTQTDAPWNLDRADQRALPRSGTYTYPTTAAGVHVYVLDTGIRISHQEFGGRAGYGRDTVDDDNDAADCHGHGTHVAGTIGAATWGMAKQVTLHAVRVIPCDGNGPKSDVIEGIDWVTANAVRPAVANMSLRGDPSEIEDTAVRNSMAAGVMYVAGAGNDSADACNYSPGRMPEVLTVGATNSSDVRASFSNYGSCLDIFAPGTGIISTWYTSDTATYTASGTSMAAPHVAGAVALYLAANPGGSPAQVHDAINGCSTTGVVGSPGSGSANRLLFIPCGLVTPPQVFENTTDVAISDWGVAHSSITVSGRPGNAPAALRVAVGIVHSYRGDLAVDLLAPDGTVYALKSARIGDPADDVDAVFTVDASGEPAEGVWQLRIRDSYGFHTGHLDQWSLTF